MIPLPWSSPGLGRAGVTLYRIILTVLDLGQLGKVDL